MFSDSDADIAFAITADSGELEAQADILVKSIRRIYPDAPILVFIPTSSISDMTETVLERFESRTTVVSGAIPIPDYPISALIKAFVEAEHKFDNQYLVALDTDTILLDRLQISGDGDVWLRPADVGAQYWTTEEAIPDWKLLYQNFGYTIPEPFIQLTASVDRREIPPYWNSGVVVTTDRSLPSRWLEYTKTIYDEEDLPVSQDEFFIDQISLAIAVQKNAIGELSQRENFPLGGRFLIPQDVAVVHYGDRRNLTRVIQPKIRGHLKQLNAIPDTSVRDIVNSILVVMSTKSGSVLGYTQKQTVRRFFRSIFSE